MTQLAYFAKLLLVMQSSPSGVRTQVTSPELWLQGVAPTGSQSAVQTCRLETLPPLPSGAGLHSPSPGQVALLHTGLQTWRTRSHQVPTAHCPSTLHSAQAGRLPAETAALVRVAVRELRRELQPALGLEPAALVALPESRRNGG